MSKLFGTDGIRGVAGEYPLDEKTVFRVGVALGEFLRDAGQQPRVVIGRDTRASGVWVESTVIDGLAASGVPADAAEVFTTAGVSFLTRTRHYGAGVVVSASHNPYRDNGIKIFAENGMKISDDAEEQIEARLLQCAAMPPGLYDSGRSIERMLAVNESFTLAYQDFLCGAAGGGGGRLKIVVDCANGAAFRVGPGTLGSLGHDALAIHDQPDGTNINVRSGALHPEVVCRRVTEVGADLGVAFDGDADRAIFSDENGRVVDGDHVLYILARHFKEQGKLPGSRIVTTSMANLGLEIALRELGIGVERTRVGDRYVLERMLKLGLNLGGEQSGHILLLGRSVAGDGILTAVELVNVLQASGKTLSELASPLRKFPQVLLSVSVARKPDFSGVPAIREVIDRVAAQLGSEGRVVVRYSGTEPVARVMIEGRRQETIHTFAQQIASVIQNELG
ncbi:MAG: phosphoglucosamine mutase [Acidobacteria bacterium]|nr:phosphoglucosamine mutase [Acidobacteriota bacterium]